MKYATHMLDGFEFLYKRTDDVLKSCKDQAMFFQKLSSTEADYAKDLTKIAKKYRPSKTVAQELGSFKACYDTVQAELENRANQHATFSANLVSEIATPILNFVKEKELTRKKLVTDGKKLTKDMADALAALATAKGNYMAKCKVADAATGHYQKAKAEGSIKPKELNKLNAKASKAAEAARAADQDYHKYLKKANDKQRKFYEQEMPQLLDEFQQFEEQRLQFLKSCFGKFTAFANEFPPFLEKSGQVLSQMHESVDIEKDIHVFLEQSKTGKSVPPEISYEPYNPTNDFAGSSSPPPASGSSGGSSSKSSKSSSKSSSTPAASAAATEDSARSTKDYGLAHLNPSMSDSEKKAALEQQLTELKAEIKADTKTKKGLEKLVKFYASDPVAQEKTAGELEEQKQKLAQMKDTQAMLESDIASLSGGGGGGGHSSRGGHDEPAQEEPVAQEEFAEEELIEDDPSKYVQARGMYDYEATNETELSFNEGDILTITDQDDSGWWFATLGDRSGFVPNNYVELV